MKSKTDISFLIAPYMAVLFYILTSIAILFNYISVLSILASIGVLCGAIGAIYRKQPFLDLWLVMLAIASLVSLIAISPLDPDFSQRQIDLYNKSGNLRFIITIILYCLFLIYFYFLNKIRKFPKKQIISILILFLLITLIIIYLRN